MATKTSKKSLIQSTTDTVKAGISDLHEEVLTTADKMVDVSLASGAKWQKLMAKAIHKGTDLLEKQQHITFDTLEEVKSQYVTGNKRFIQLLGLNQSKANKAAKLKKEGVAKAKKQAKKVVAQVEKVAKPMVKTTEQVVAKDSLRALKGIGPKVESLLNEAGIRTYADLAAAPVKELKAILNNAGSVYQTMDPTAWKKEAKAAIDKRNK